MAQDVFNPDYYLAQGSAGQRMEVIDIIEAYGLSFCGGNALKYLLRAGVKRRADQSVAAARAEDLGKARWYGARMVTHWHAQALSNPVSVTQRATPDAVIKFFGITGVQARAVVALLRATKAYSGGCDLDELLRIQEALRFLDSACREADEALAAERVAVVARLREEGL